MTRSNLVAVATVQQPPRDIVFHGDCLDVLRTLPDCSVDAVVTDPPAGISFMGKDWDGDKGGRHAWIAWMRDVMQECMRVVKPGGHALVWALPRTSHWTACALEDAGWEIRDCLYHIFGSGFPKSLDVSKAIDKAAGATRDVVGVRDTRSMYDGSTRTSGQWDHGHEGWDRPWKHDPEHVKAHNTITAPATDAARQWDGWGTALKPAVECWWLVRKPLAAGNVAANVLAYGTGAINVDACRVNPGVHVPGGGTFGGIFGNGKPANHEGHIAGRWPANLLLSHAADCTQAQCVPWCPAAVLDGQSGERSGSRPHTYRNSGAGMFAIAGDVQGGYGDTGGASRYFAQFFYSSKASRRERNAGLDGLPEVQARDYAQDQWTSEHMPFGKQPQANHHPTVKPLSLMRWLCRLITPSGGTVLDPFGGSGTTGVAAVAEGFGYVLIERDADYVEIIRRRVAHAEATAKTPQPQPQPAQPRKPARKKPQPQRITPIAATVATVEQCSLWRMEA